MFYIDKVSIIIPVYNIKEYLPKCLDSLLCQSYKNIEIILVDDGSTDGVDDIYAKYVSPLIKVIKKENGGVSSARNLGIDVAAGKYLMFVDGDDWVEKDFVYNMILEMENNDIDLCMCNVNKIENNSIVGLFGSELKDCVYYSKDMYNMILANTGAVWNKIFITEKVKKIKFNTECHIAEDSLFVAQYLLKCKSIKTLSYCGYNYLQRPNSAFHDIKNKRFLSLFKTGVCMVDTLYGKSFGSSFFAIEYNIRILNSMIKNLSYNKDDLNAINELNGKIKEHYKKVKKLIFSHSKIKWLKLRLKLFFLKIHSILRFICK